MNNEIKEKYLPIGTVVEVKDAQIALMVTGYCMKAQGEESDKEKIYDYCACPYPAGITNSAINIVFDHDNIEKVLFMGYESDEYKELNDFIKEELERVTKEENE